MQLKIRRAIRLNVTERGGKAVSFKPGQEKALAKHLKDLKDKERGTLIKDLFARGAIVDESKPDPVEVEEGAGDGDEPK